MTRRHGWAELRGLGFGAWTVFAMVLGLAVVPACTNNPYPHADDSRRVLYREMESSPPKTLDPAVAYSVVDHLVTGTVYDTLLDYDYLARPFRLIPGLVESVPEERAHGDGTRSLRFRLRADLVYADDDCFALAEAGRRSRSILAADVAFQMMRLADPSVGSPVATVLTRIVGYAEFTERLQSLRDADPLFAARRIDEQYEAAGGIAGVRVLSERDFEVVLSEAFPQLLYWFAMEFTTPIPWEAVAYYDGEEGRDLFSEHAVATGPFRITRYDKRTRISFVRNEAWYGLRHPEWRAPAATYPTQGSPEDEAAGLLDPRYVGRPLPFLDGIELVFEKEAVPGFNKFLQGYYDMNVVVDDTFDQVVAEGGLTPRMEEMGVELSTTPLPALYYLGFNMNDAVVGREGLDRSRKLRQAMSLSVDADEFIRLFFSERAVPAESPIPPGIFGYEAGQGNPYRRFDPDRARELLAEAGYRRGVDPSTGKPLRLVLATGSTSTASLLRYQFFTDAWRRIGLDVEIVSTNYNQFQDVLRRGAYQLFFFGWSADYPDPENFLFLLYGPHAKATSGGPNYANFEDPEYDRLFLEMRSMPNGPERRELIARMLEIVRRERPWIELFTPEDYDLYHGWLHNLKPFGMSVPMMQYLDVDPERRAERRTAWNQPVEWPAWVLVAAIVAAIVPGIVTFLRERQ